MDWEKYYKLPLKLDEYVDNIVWTSDSYRAFDFIDDDFPVNNDMKEAIVNIINDEPTNYIFTPESFIGKEEIIYYIKDKKPIPFIVIRGWGYLTGSHSLNIDVAIMVQNGFRDFILNKLNNKNYE